MKDCVRDYRFTDRQDSRRTAKHAKHAKESLIENKKLACVILLIPFSVFRVVSRFVRIALALEREEESDSDDYSKNRQRDYPCELVCARHAHLLLRFSRRQM